MHELPKVSFEEPSISTIGRRERPASVHPLFRSTAGREQSPVFTAKVLHPDVSPMSMETAVLKACQHRAARREAVKRHCALRWYVEAGDPLDFRLNRNSDLEETSILRPSIAKFDVKFISERET